MVSKFQNPFIKLKENVVLQNVNHSFNHIGKRTFYTTLTELDFDILNKELSLEVLKFQPFNPMCIPCITQANEPTNQVNFLILNGCYTNEIHSLKGIGNLKCI